MAKAKKMKRDILRHECILPDEEEPIIRFIDSGSWVFFRRFIRRLMLVSENNPRSSRVFHSKASYRREMERHMQHYYWMIHPFSDFILSWKKIMTFLTCLALLTYPLVSYYSKRHLFRLLCFKFALDVFFFADIIINFNSGYLNEQTNKVTLRRKQSAKYYLKKWFILDFICTINVDFLILMYSKRTLFVKLLNYVRILRIATLIKHLNDYREYRKFSLYKFNFFKIIFITLILIFWLTSFLYFLTFKLEEKWSQEKSLGQRTVTCLYRVAYLFFLIGFGEHNSTHNRTITFEMLCWIIGVVMRFFVIAEIVQIVSKYNASSNKYHQRIQRLRNFMQHKGLPLVTCNRIIQYFDFRFQKTFYKEEQILSTLSVQLQQEIMFQTCKKLIENVTIFKNLPTGFLLKMLDYLKSIIFLPNDIIVQAGTAGDCMYFIYNGTVAVYTGAGVEVCHLSDGANFGEVSMVMKDQSRIATVVAVDTCELYVLSSEDFGKAIAPYPDLFNRIRKIADVRYLKTSVYESKSTTHFTAI